MLDETSMSLWAKVCATVNRLGEPRSSRARAVLVETTEPRILDLHGHKIHEAYFVVKSFIENTPHRQVTIVTGQGQIARELQDWVAQSPRYLDSLPLNGGGAFSVRLRRR